MLKVIPDSTGQGVVCGALEIKPKNMFHSTSGPLSLKEASMGLR